MNFPPRLLAITKFASIIRMRDEPPKPKPHWSIRLVMGKRPKWTIIRAVLWILVSFVLFKFALVPIKVRGESMAPTLKNSSVHLVNRLAYTWRKPQRGDIVTVTVEEHGLYLVKRIVGMPGDRFSIHDGAVY